jgi:hypothetical protein
LVAEPRPTHVASRERCAATPAGNAFALFVASITRRYVGSATRHVIRSHSHNLGSSHAIDFGFDRASLESTFVLAALLPRRTPSYPAEVHQSRDRWPARECERRACSCSFEKFSRAWVRKRASRGCLTRSPGSSSSGHLGSPTGPPRRRNNVVRAFGWSKIQTFGSGASFDAIRNLGNPPREGRDPGLNRGAFSPSV